MASNAPVTTAEAMTTCDECGLPMDICNALAMYRKAADLFGSGKPAQAAELAAAAREFEAQYTLKREQR